MTRFPKALQEAITELGWTQTTLADRCGIPRDRVNKYVNGTIRVGPEMVDQLCKALPDQQRALVICAYLEDRVPESGRELVTITAFGGRTPKLASNLPAPVRAALEAISRRAVMDSAVAELIVTLRGVLYSDRS